MKPERSAAQKMGYYKSCLRSLWRASPMRWEAWRRARVAPGVLKCEKCGVQGNAKLFEIDHINPVVDPERGDEGIEVWVYRLNCDASELQTLCEMCHKIKTTAEHKERHRNGTGPFSPSVLSGKSEPVIAVNVETGRTVKYSSPAKACRALLIDPGNLSRVLSGERESLNGWVFQKIGTRQKKDTSTIVVDTMGSNQCKKS